MQEKKPVKSFHGVIKFSTECDVQFQCFPFADMS